MTAGRAAAVGAAVVLLLSACGSDVRGELRNDVAEITAEANSRDADALRRSVDVLLGRLSRAVAEGTLAPQEAADIERIALAVQQHADLIDRDLIRQREAEAERQRLKEEQRRLEEERRQAEEAAREAEEAAREAEEEAERIAEEEQARKAEEEAARKAEEEERKRLEKEQEQQEKEDEDSRPSPAPVSPSPSPTPTPQ